ncbi:MAG: hypothetical protein HKP61_13400 [Dactylosporangium sp.]|nr:hypothetical protein [Dactylosporangium sp.]NNJ61911.1 hypothetical protein [Dactylosporangium sp.]
MNPSWTPADVTRVLNLIATPLALEILDGLGCGRAPDATAPPETNPTIIAEAIERLREVGAVTVLDLERHTCELTPRGRRLLSALKRVSEAIEAQAATDRPDVP